MKFNSFRRYYLDQALEDNKDIFKGNILDIGGKKINKRGTFVPPVKLIDNWIYLNNDKKTKPDILADLPIIPLKKNSIDVILCTEVLEYIHDFKTLVKEMHRVLKTNGILILSTPFIHTFHKDHEKDYFRFTESLLKKELKYKFCINKFYRLGGLVAVIYDLLKSYITNKIEITITMKIVLKFILFFVPLVKYLDKHLFNDNFYINTGFLLIGVKK